MCTLAVMAYEHTAGMKGAAGGASNASDSAKILTKLTIYLQS